MPIFFLIQKTICRYWVKLLVSRDLSWLVATAGMGSVWGLDRASWEETLDWMVEEQGMPPLDAESQVLVLDYLATHYGGAGSGTKTGTP